MKYINNLLIITVLSLIVGIHANASEINSEDFSVKSFKYSSTTSKTISNNKFENYRYQPSELYITKKDYSLQSSMKKHFVFRKYTIKNISQEPVSLKFDKGTDLTLAVDKTRNIRKTSQSKTAFLIPLKDGYYDAYNMIGANNGILFFAGIGSVIYNYGIKFPVFIGKSVFNIAASPVYYFKNKKDDELIENDIKSIKAISTNTPDNYILQPDEYIQARNLFQTYDYPTITAKLQNDTIYKFDVK